MCYEDDEDLVGSAFFNLINFCFSFTYETVPDIDLKLPEGEEIQNYSCVTTQEDIDKAIFEYRNNHQEK